MHTTFEKNNLQSVLVKDYERIWTDFLKKEYHEEHINHHISNRSAFYDVINKYLANKDKPNTLELGCGTSIDLNIIAQTNQRALCFGTDISKKSILLSIKIRNIFENKIEYFVSDVRNLPIKKDFFDLIFSQGLVEHFSNPYLIIEEQLRILKSSGILIINVPQKYTGYTLMKKTLMKNDKWELGWETEFSYKNLKAMGKQLGIIEREAFGYQYWKSWKEPVFVLRDLYDKFHRRNPFKDLRIFQIIKRIHDSIWDRLEKKWGHYFMENIVIVFQKKIV